MQVKSIPQLVNFISSLLTIFVTKINAVPIRNSFIAVHSPSVDLLGGIVSVADANPSTLLRVQKLYFTSIYLTTAEADKVKAKLKSANGILAPNNPIAVDDIITTDGHLSDVNIISYNTAHLQNPLLNSIPKCDVPLNGVDFVVLDTVIYNNISEFSNVKIVYGPNFVNNSQACNPHASQLTSIMVGKNFGVIPNGDRSIYNIGVFDCNGYGLAANIILGLQTAIKFAGLNKLKGRGTVAHFSGVRGVNAAVDAATSALELEGVPTFIAAGDSGINSCLAPYSPIAVKSFTSGSTTSPGNIPAPFTNYGSQCLNLFLPGVNLNVVNVTDGNVMQVSGTTYSSAIAAALGGMEVGLDIKATTAEVTQRITATPRTEIINPTAASLFQQPMTVMLQDNVCPYNRIFNSITANKLTRNKFHGWYNTTSSQDVFCVTFSVRTNDAGIVIGLRRYGTDPNIIAVTIDKRKNGKAFTHSIIQGDVTLAKSNTAKRIIKEKTSTIITLSRSAAVMSLWYDAKENTNPTLLLFANVTMPIQEIAFASIRGAAKFGQALKCIN